MPSAENAPEVPPTPHIESSEHGHPRPARERLTQCGALVLLIAMLLASLAQFALGLFGLPLVFIMGLFTLLLAAPVVMLTTITPAVTVTPQGLLIRPVLWPGRSVAWDQIRAVKPNPLLPPAGAEIGRRALAGRAHYRPAEGLLLVIPSLPVYYRIAGLFAGEGFTGVIGLTNRAHSDYGRLARAVLAYAGKPAPARDSTGD